MREFKPDINSLDLDPSHIFGQPHRPGGLSRKGRRNVGETIKIFEEVGPT